VNTSFIPAAAFKSGLLDRDYHERLLSDLPQLVAKAGVPMHAVWSRLSDYCTAEEIAWVRDLRCTPDNGIVFYGDHFAVPVEDKMVAIAGVCLRNYTDARLMPVQEVIRRLKDDDMPTPSVLLIPNFCLPKDGGGDMPTWETTHLMGLLINRMGKGLKTILYCSSLETAEKQYGKAFRAHLESGYALANADEVKLVQSKHQEEVNQ